MRGKKQGKLITKMGMLAVMMLGLMMLVPQMVMSIEGSLFGAVWLVMAMMGTASVWHTYRSARQKAVRREIYSLKKKLRTPVKEARSRITVRLKA
ncbi:MAG: hypothetical protein J6B02_03145 [Selenomonadales bacterium]|nr:hypothetical protein [Selenomonadales bacterium]